MPGSDGFSGDDGLGGYLSKFILNVVLALNKDLRTQGKESRT